LAGRVRTVGGPVTGGGGGEDHWVRKGGLEGGSGWWVGGAAAAGWGRCWRRRGWCWRTKNVRKKMEMIIGPNRL
jgi:hypothetical protein